MKKTLKKPASKPKTTPERVGNPHTAQFPHKGHTCRGHTNRRPCFRVDLFGTPSGESDTFHFFDEGGAVLFAMQQSRSHGYVAVVNGPDGKEVCQFRARSYDVDAVRHAYWEYNEKMHIGGDVYTQRNEAATKARRARTQRELSKTPPKKKVLKKR